MYFSDQDVQQLDRMAQQLRLDALDMIYHRGQGHIGGAFSMAEIVTALFFHHLRIRPEEPEWPERDRFVLGKGHACATLYAALARRGYFPKEDLETFGRIGSPLQGHPCRLKTRGIDMSAGCLGHALPIAAGLGLAARLEKRGWRTYALLGDGECQAGVVWEGAMVVGKYRLANVTTIVDHNDVQNDGASHEVMPVEPLAAKFRSFNLEVMEIDGHDMRQVLESIELAGRIYAAPVVIIAHTTKGRGVSFMENTCHWHGGAPTDEQYAQARAELEGALKR
jgi:transketolase